jgi:endonuclease/exonuclease/phosphatase (EEP) superfamily protein YafD
MILVNEKRIAFRLAATLIATAALAGCAVFDESVNDTLAEIHTSSLACSHQLARSDRSADDQIALGELDSESIRLVSWNIQKGGDLRWTTDLAKLEADPDLIVLQEVPLTSNAWGALPADKIHSFSPGYRTRRSLTGVMTVSTVKPLTQCNLATVEPWVRSPKATLITEYGLTKTDQTLLVVNIHAVNFTLGTYDFHKQFQQAFSVLNNHAGPILMSGDFNTWHRWRSKVLKKMTDSLGLEMLDYDEDHRKRFLGQPLDHIYVRGLEVLEATTLHADSSDHNPMSVHLRL